jgi:AcrR family transcriptional regulator
MRRRDERKRETRQALLEGALALMSEGKALATLGLREIAREAGVVPTAFYRHFRDLDELGGALADNVGLALRKAFHEARLTARNSPNDSVRAFLAYVRANPHPFEILARERVAAPRAVREAIEREIRFFVTEFANELRAFPALASSSDVDRALVADLIINIVLLHTGEALELPKGSSTQEHELIDKVVKQVQLILAGATHWKS